MLAVNSILSTLSTAPKSVPINMIYTFFKYAYHFECESVSSCSKHLSIIIVHAHMKLLSEPIRSVGFVNLIKITNSSFSAAFLGNAITKAVEGRTEKKTECV